MSRDQCAKRLMNVVSVIEDVSLDVTLLFPMVDDFIISITDRLHSSIKEGELAEKVLSSLKKD